MAKQNDSFSSGLGSVWIQPEGPNTKPDYLMCAELADLTKPRGEINRTYCVDPATGKWFVATRLRQPGDPPSTTITVPIGPTQRWLERIGDCPVAVYLHQNTGGRKDSFLAYDRAQVLPWAMVTQQTEANISMREANDQSTAAFEIESDWALVQYPMTKVRQTTAGVEPLNDVFFYNVRQCLGPNGSMKEVGVDGIAIADSEAACQASLYSPPSVLPVPAGPLMICSLAVEHIALATLPRNSSPRWLTDFAARSLNFTSNPGLSSACHVRQFEFDGCVDIRAP